MLALFVSSAFLITASGGPPPLLQPTTYVSPCGEFELFVDPTHRLGRGPGRYRMSRAGEIVWSRELPLTLWEAAVDDVGRCAGYAFVEDPSHKSPGELIIAVFAPDGSELVEQRVPRKWVLFNAPPHATPNSVFVQPDLDRFVLRTRVYDGQTSLEEWWPYELSTGRALEHSHGDPILADGLVEQTLDARAVLGTPLTLVHWKRDDHSGELPARHGGRFALLDAEWKAVWSLDLVDDYASMREDDRGFWELQRSGALMPDVRQPRRFEIVRYAEKQVVTYEVEAASQGASAWNVLEIGRRAFTASTSPTVAKLDLPPRGVVELEHADGPSRELREPYNVYIDVLGRIVIADGATRALHVFDSLGKLAFVWEPASGAAGVPRWPADIDADDEGRFRVQLDRTNEGFVVIERDRARGPVVAPGINRFAARRGTSEFWGRFHKNFEEAEELRCVSGDGVVRATFARRPDGRWWREIDAVGVATDGSVAVLDKPRWLTTDSRERTLALYAPDGKDARLIELPREDVVARSQHHLVVGARWIVLQTEEPGVCLVSRADGSLHHFEEPSFDSNNRWTAALSPDERELWIARMTPPTLLRYALPAE